jgi:hypothetical protein
VLAWSRQRKAQEVGSSAQAQALVDSLVRESNRVHRPKYLKAEAWASVHGDTSQNKDRKARRIRALAEEKRKVDHQISAKVNLFSALYGFPGAGALGTKKYAQISLLMDRVTKEDEGFWNHSLAQAFMDYQIFPEDCAKWQDRQRESSGLFAGHRLGSLPGVEWVEQEEIRNAINPIRISIGLPALFPYREDDIKWIFSSITLGLKEWDCGK